MKRLENYILKITRIIISLHLLGVYPILCKSYYSLFYKTMSFEEELEAIDREQWLAKFDDRQVMMAARMFLEWLYHLPDDWQPQEYSEFTF